jgi:hypothetical protein
MRRAFGDDENIGLLFRNMEEYQRDVKTCRGSESLAKVQLPASTTARFTPLNSVVFTTGIGDAVDAGTEEHETYHVWQKNLEIISCFLSICCLLAVTIVWVVQKSITIQLTRNVLFLSRDASFVDNMRLWHNAVGESCAAGSFDLIMTQPPWTNDNKQKYDGLSMEGAVHAAYIDLTAVAFFIYVFSSLFQGVRYIKFSMYNWKPVGPEFSRWLEYALTSPLQVVLVALSFGISNIDIILGFFGMQLAMVLMGYSIEKQTNKKYLHTADKKTDKFYYFTFFGDIRGLVYILVSWTLHFLIWGLPGLWEAQIVRWGIAGQYAFVHQYQKKCGDKNFQMPAFVDVIFFGQFICFVLFGVVCTVQYFSAGHLGAAGETKTDIKNKKEYKTTWAKYSLAYAVLSVTAKTILEVGFLGLVATSPEYLKPRPVPKAAVVRYASVKQVSLANNRTVSVPSNTTCYSIGPR